VVRENVNPEYCEQSLAAIANYFMQTEDNDWLAKLLAQSRLELQITTETAPNYNPDGELDGYENFNALKYIFHVPPKLHYAIISSYVHEQIAEVIKAVMGSITYDYQVDIAKYDVDWRMRLVAEADTGKVTNQNNWVKNPLVYMGMKYSSSPEVKIAEALEKDGIMYFPNCAVRVGTANNRQSYVPDFLILHMGKWGILEVDGQTYHTPKSATKDHERSQLIQSHGKLYVARFDAMRCKDDPVGVIDEFLKLLKLNG
jgi:hypothetical protein